MPRFTESKDGRRRATFLVPIRLTAEEIEEMKGIAKEDGKGFRDVLEEAMILGIEGYKANRDFGS